MSDKRLFMGDMLSHLRSVLVALVYLGYDHNDCAELHVGEKTV